MHHMTCNNSTCVHRGDYIRSLQAAHDDNYAKTAHTNTQLQ